MIDYYKCLISSLCHVYTLSACLFYVCCFFSFHFFPLHYVIQEQASPWQSSIKEENEFLRMQVKHVKSLSSSGALFFSIEVVFIFDVNLLMTGHSKPI